MPRRALRVCSEPGCPEYTQQGRCPEHQREADLRRGTAHQRGYGARHRNRFRRGVLDAQPVCVLCRAASATEADHWPRSRRDLQAAGLDADDPQYGRGLCHACHSRETAEHQPGGWANQQ